MRVYQSATLVSLQALLFACAFSQSTDESVFLGKTLDGNLLQTEIFHGKPIVVAFWASWCAPCKEELPRLELIQQFYGSDKLVVIAVNQGESRKAVRKLLNYWGEDLEMLVTFDSRERVGRHYKIKGLPTTILINAEGAVQWRNVGYQGTFLDELNNQISVALAASDEGN
jgi:thiol-disulfide isomerase/thioredoxin